MRVVSGEARGRRLVAPAGQDTRPTTDRVRESMFNALESLEAVAGATVLDLFAGSGALGIEALSRGAARCTFVEHDRAALAAVRANLEATGLAGRAEVVSGDAHRALTSFSAAGRRFDLALLDPPYARHGLAPGAGRPAGRPCGAGVRPGGAPARRLGGRTFPQVRGYRGGLRPPG